MQLEESEFTCAAAVKARKSMEVEIEDLHVQMEDMSKAKQAVSPTVPPSSRPFPWQLGAAPFIHLPFPRPFGPVRAAQVEFLLLLLSGKRVGGSNNPSLIDSNVPRCIFSQTAAAQ